jgi:predicted DNA-binding transcriptional regulator YafY
MAAVDQTFERESPKEIWSEEDYTGKMIDLILKFDAELAYRLYDEFPVADILANGDGSFTVKTSIPFSDWIYGYIMSFGEHAEVLEPAELKNEIRNKYEKVLRKYL